MANSTTNLDLISASQASKEVTANALADAGSPATLFGRRATTTTGLTWGFYGGVLNVAGTPTQIANGTVALTGSATNYVEATTAGVVSANTSAFTAGRLRLYTVICDASGVNPAAWPTGGYQDHRHSGTGAGIAGGPGTVTSVAATVPAFLSVSGSPITTSGTLAISYSGTALPVANGGTGATSASAARTELGLVIGTDVQAYNARLADIAGITYAQGDVLYHNGTNLVKLAAGTSGQFLKTQGTGANPVWSSASGATLADGDYGDITVSGSGATMTIDAGAVTYAKLQDVSATSRILGRKTAGAGDAEECTMSEVLDMVGSAAQGDILYRNATAWVRLAAGTSGHFLKTQGAGANPMWDAASGGGGTPGGSDTQLQFNDAGAFGGDADLAWNKTSNILYIGGPGTIQGAAVGSTSNGNLVTIKGGAGGSTSGNGGGVTISGGTVTDGDGGGVTVSAAAGVGTNKPGGAINITGGANTGNGTPGAINITGGENVASGPTGGHINIVGGAATASPPSTPGEVRITGGATGTGSTGGYVVITGGAATGGNYGGKVTITGGAGNSGGNVELLGKDSAGSFGAPGNVTVTAGNAAGGFAVGGAVTLTGGNGASGWRGGAVLLKPGTGSPAGNVGMDNGGAIATNATGGFFLIPTCAGTPTGTPASVPTGAVPLVFDTTGVKLWIYTGGAWKGVVVA